MSQHSSELARSSNALQQLALYANEVTREAAARTIGNLRIEAIRQEKTLTERFLAYMEMGLDRKIVEADTPLRISAIAFTDRGSAKHAHELEVGADMACFIRYDLPGLRWAKGFLGQSKLAKAVGVDATGKVQVSLRSEAEYDQMIRDCVAMRRITEESYVFFFSPESVTVEKASALLGDLAEMQSEKPWRDVHQFREDKGIGISKFYAAFVSCQLGSPLLDRPAIGFNSVLDLIHAKGIAVVLLVMVTTAVPLPTLERNSPELAALPFEVPETYWQWGDLMTALMNTR